MSEPNFEEKMVSSKNVFNGVLLNVNFDEISLPDGRKATREYITHIGAVCVIPITDDGKVIIERQYRYPIGQLVTEIPAGKLDFSDEDRLEAAKRELREETGYTADNWRDIGLFYPAPAYSDEKITMFLATGLHKGETELDEDEFIEVDAVPLKELVSDVLSGKITDAKTQLAILKANALLQ